jgi:hypothetical protein
MQQGSNSGLIEPRDLMKEVARVYRASLPSDNAKSRTSELMRLADSLEIGERLFIPVVEWAASGFKSPPTTLVHNSSYHPRARIFGKKFSMEKQGRGKLHTGWFITRRP